MRTKVSSHTLTTRILVALFFLAVVLLSSTNTIGVAVHESLYLNIFIGHYRRTCLYLALWGLALILMWSVTKIRSLTIRCVWASLIFASTVIAELTVQSTGSNINDQTIDLFWNSRYSSNSFLATHWLEIAVIAFKALGLYVLLIFFGSTQRSSSKIFWIAPMLGVVAAFLIFGYTNGNGFLGVPPQFSTTGVVAVWLSNRDDHPVKAEVDIVRVSPPLIEHVLFIVDESIRGDYLDLNGAKDITPFLASHRDHLINFGLASSANNCTATSNAFLRMGVNPLQMEHNADDLRQHPSIWKYARQSGFLTAFVDNQRSIGQLQNYMDEKEVELIDQFRQYRGDQERMYRDHNSVAVIRAIQESAPQTFIYLNKAGAHFHYETAYPETAAIFSPHLAKFEPAINRERMVNSYKNAVRWSVDEFFAKLLPILDLSNTLVIYTSDHGQNLLDDGSSITHCRVGNPIDEEALVPLFVMTENRELREKFQKVVGSALHKSSHLQIFPTLLQVMGYAPKRVKERYYLSLFEVPERSVGFTTSETIKRFGKNMQWRSIQWHPVRFFGTGKVG